MTPPIVAQDLEGLIQDIDAAFAWLESMGIKGQRGGSVSTDEIFSPF
jgi:hypothetical protein